MALTGTVRHVDAAGDAGSTGVLRVADAALYYEVHGSGPLLVLVGAPMDAVAFAPVAELLAADHTVLTTDPRGVHRSPVDDPERDSTPELRADDLARLIEHVGGAPAAVFGSSGGAVSALALAQHHPELVHTVVAHEPPLHTVLADSAAIAASTEDYCATYLAGDVLGAWRKFFAAADIPMPEPVLQQMFGTERDPQQLADEHHWFAHELRPTVGWVPHVDALRAGAPRVVVGVGTDSTGQICDRTSAALAAALGIAPTTFPGGHTAFAEDPATFAPALRAVLSA